MCFAMVYLVNFYLFGKELQTKIQNTVFFKKMAINLFSKKATQLLKIKG